MNTSSIFEQAVVFCLKAHAKQVRKGTSIPYATHPIAAMLILSHYTKNEAVLIAALLHDVVEDTGYSLDDIREQFSDEVADLVGQVSEIKTSPDGKRLPWTVRKKGQLESLRKTGTKEALMIKVADHIHNLKSMAEDSHQDRSLNSFNSTVAQRISYSKKILATATAKDVDQKLLNQLRQTIKHTKDKLA